MAQQTDALGEEDHAEYMRMAIGEAKAAHDRGDRPIGCVIVHDGHVV